MSFTKFLEGTTQQEKYFESMLIMAEKVNHRTRLQILSTGRLSSVSFSITASEFHLQFVISLQYKYLVINI